MTLARLSWPFLSFHQVLKAKNTSFERYISTFSTTSGTWLQNIKEALLEVPWEYAVRHTVLTYLPIIPLPRVNNLAERSHLFTLPLLWSTPYFFSRWFKLCLIQYPFHSSFMLSITDMHDNSIAKGTFFITEHLWLVQSKSHHVWVYFWKLPF